VSRARLYWGLGVVCVAIAVAASSASGAGRVPASDAQASSAGTFVRNVLQLRVSRQYGRLWSRLHPTQKVFVIKSRFVACEKRKDAALGAVLRLIAFNVLRTYPEKILIPGTQQTTQSTGVRYRYTMRTTGDENVGPITDSSHAVRLNGRWTWLVSAKDASAYKAGNCRAS
jgi:hypothetical protein